MRSVDRILLSVSRIGVFLTPFVPLIVTASMFFPFITGKNFTFRIIVEIIFACWLLLLSRAPAYRPTRSLLLWSIAAFIGVVFLADLLAINPFKAFWSNFERMEGFITLAHLFAYFLVASSVLNADKWWQRFFATSVGVSAFLGIYGLLQLAGKIPINQGGARLDGTFGNAAYFAGYMLFHIFLTLFLLYRHRVPPFVKWLYAGAIVLQTVTLYYTATRGAAVGLVGGLVLAMVLVAIGERQRKALRTTSIIVVLFLFILVGTLYVVKDSAPVQHNPILKRFASISLQSAGPRFMVWGMAWKGFKEHPILGWGQEGFNYVFNKYYDPNMWTQEQWFDRTHDIFFDWLIAAGILGLLSYLALFVFLLWYLWRPSARAGAAASGNDPFSFIEKSLLTGLLFGYVIHNFFVFDNLISYIFFFSLIAYIHSRYGTPFRVFEKLAPASEQTYSIIASVLLITLIGGVYFLNVRPVMVSLDLIEGLKPQPKGPADNLAFYQKAFAYQTIGTQEVAEQVMQAAITVANAAGVSNDTKTQFISFAADAMKREVARAPSDARLRMFMGGFYNRLGNFTEALPHMIKAHELSPAKQTIAFELSNTYLSTGKVAEALALTKNAFEEAPAFESARQTYTIVAVYAKDFRLADTLFASSTNQAAFTDDRLVKAYYAAKQYPKVISLLKLRIEHNPKDAQTYVSLAAAYLTIGSRSDAVASLQKAIELNPDFKKQGEYYISEIKAGRNP